MTGLHFEAVHSVALSLFAISKGLFWQCLPVAFLLAILGIFVSGQIHGKSFELLFRRTIIAIALLVAFPQISSTIQGLGSGLTSAFGGEQSITEVFSKVSERAKAIKEGGLFSWIKLGEASLTIITTLSFIVLLIIEHFFAVLELVIWNLLHILGPLALLACLFPTLSNIPKGIFMGMLEIALWKPVWVILTRILLAIGFAEAPIDPSHWFDLAIMNFAVAGLMASTPMIVHGFLSGSLAAVGASAVQTMILGTGATMAGIPMNSIQSTAQKTRDIGREGTNKFLVNPLKARLQSLVPKKFAQSVTKPPKKG